MAWLIWGHMGWNTIGNNRGGLDLIRARIDRAVANREWCKLFPRSYVREVADSVSDHHPIIFDSLGLQDTKPKAFKFENMWARDIRTHWVIKKAWNSVTHNIPGTIFKKKVHMTKKALTEWNRSQFGQLKSNIHSKK